MQRLLVDALFLVILASAARSECPPGTIPGPKYCYSFVDKPGNYSEAKGNCSSLGGWLASSPNAFVNSFLASHVGSDEHWLIGFGMKALDGFYWEDDATWNYTKWARGEPGELWDPKCVTVEATTGLWHAVNPAETRKYVCQFPPAVTKQSMKPTPPGAVNCDDGWTYLNSAKKCVKAVNIVPYKTDGDRREWADALQQCRLWGGDLLSIHSAAETAEITNLIGLNAIELAIGLYFVPGSCDAGKCEAFWTDGSPLDYQFWAASYPQMGQQDYGGCVHIIPYPISILFGGAGRWTNDQCFDLAGCLCQKTPTL